MLENQLQITATPGAELEFFNFEQSVSEFHDDKNKEEE
jgi:hypothetical protein